MRQKNCLSSRLAARKDKFQDQVLKNIMLTLTKLVVLYRITYLYIFLN